jgi:hypothetical protein
MIGSVTILSDGSSNYTSIPPALELLGMDEQTIFTFDSFVYREHLPLATP